jgi:hypothetical protein
MTRIDKRSQDRIRKAVLWVEKNKRPEKTRPQPNPRRGPSNPWLAVAYADIDHNNTGEARVAFGETGFFSTSAEEITVYNPGLKVWSGSELLLVYPSWTSEVPEFDVWYIARAWSATRIRGIAAADISPQASGSLNNVVSLDGHFSPTTASVFLPTTEIAIQAGFAVWAELVYGEDPSPYSRWEVYSADCEAVQ